MFLYFFYISFFIIKWNNSNVYVGCLFMLDVCLCWMFVCVGCLFVLNVCLCWMFVCVEC